MSAASLAVPAVAWGTGVHATSRLDDIRNRGHVICGVLPGIPGFAVREPGGRYRGLEIDFCRALAAAVLGDAEKVEFLVVRTVDEFKENHSVDVAVRRLTWTLRREAETGLLFGPVIFHDGAGFLVRRGIDDAHGLAERPVCVRSGSEANRALVGFARARDVALIEVPKRALAEAVAGLAAGECDALAADVSELAGARGELDEGYRILPERFSEEPLAPLVRQGDDAFFLVIRWLVYGLIAAEEAGVTSRNPDPPRGDHLPGAGVDTGSGLGLDRAWLRNVIRGVGNYGEIYDRHLGPASANPLTRGPNELWTRGGLMYAPPLH